jgi:hypothetical protein
MSRPIARLALAALVAAAVAAAACDDNNTVDPGPIIPPSTTDTFAATLAPGASAFYSFPTFIDGTARVMLASVTEGTTANGAALSPTLTLGLGIPQGIDCATFTTVQASPGLVPQIDGYGLVPGTYCVRIADTGGALTATSSFLVRMTYPNAPTHIETAEKNEQFDTTLAVGGSSSRTLTASKSGNVQIRLQSLGNGVSRIGVGFGVPRTDETCAFTRSMETGPGGSFSIGVVAGRYCLRVYDVGALTSPTGFNVSLIYP